MGKVRKLKTKFAVLHAPTGQYLHCDDWYRNVFMTRKNFIDLKLNSKHSIKDRMNTVLKYYLDNKKLYVIVEDTRHYIKTFFNTDNNPAIVFEECIIIDKSKEPNRMKLCSCGFCGDFILY